MAGPYDLPWFEPRHRELADRARRFAAAQVADAPLADVDAECRRFVRALGADGWLRHGVGAEMDGAPGGGPIDVRALCVLRETFARESALLDFAFAMQGLGTGSIGLAGSAALRRAYIPKVVAGTAIAAFALSEPDAGSDVAAVATTATRHGDSFVLDGEKTWISNGGIADFYVVFARTGEGAGSKGLSAFVVDADADGLSIAARIETMAPHPMATLRFRGCRVGAERLLGVAGDGFKIAMRTLDVFRPSVAAAAVGLARRALDEAARHAGERRMFGQTLGEFQLTQAAIGDMATAVDASAMLAYRAAWLQDAHPGGRFTTEASMAKLFATEQAQSVIDRAVQLFGGLGVTVGHPVERLYREIRALRIYEGASEVQRLIVGRHTLAQAVKEGVR